MAHPTVSIQNYRTKSTFWLTMLGLIVIPPFWVHSIYTEKVLVSIETTMVLAALAGQAWMLHKQKYVQEMTSYVLMPIVILFLVSSAFTRNISGIMWCYPSIVAFFFMMPRYHAVIASVVLSVGIIPTAFFVLDIELAYRVAATIVCTGLFSGTFVMLIERQQHQLALKEQQRREAMASASHELRTPLATLMGQVDAMIDGIRPVDHKGLNRLSSDIAHISRLVDDLFLLSQSDVQAVSYSLAPVSVMKVFIESENAYTMALTEKQLTVHNNLLPDHLVQADSQRLRQIFDNLLSNCCRYSNTGGDIYIASRISGKHIIINISDSGPGVTDIDLPLLFDRFYRIEKSRARAAGGSGLGLSLVKVLVEGQGGVISAYHAEEGGLGFEICLPKG